MRSSSRRAPRRRRASSVPVAERGDRRGADDRHRRAGHGGGFLALLLSPVPMVRGFGELLIVGIAIALACALTAGSAAMVLSRRRTAARRGRLARWRAPSLRTSSGASARGRGGDRRRRRRLGSRHRADLGARAGRSPRAARAARAACCSSACCWPSSAGSPARRRAVQSDVTKLVPPNMPALRDLRTLERVTGVSGEIDVTRALAQRRHAEARSAG